MNNTKFTAQETLELVKMGTLTRPAVDKSIRDARRGLDLRDSELIDLNSKDIKKFSRNMGEEGARELLAKLGMFMLSKGI